MFEITRCVWWATATAKAADLVSFCACGDFYFLFIYFFKNRCTISLEKNVNMYFCSFK